MPDVKVLSPARAAGLLRHFPKECWSKRLLPFKVWDEVRLKIDPRHRGDVVGVHGTTVTVRWEPHYWISEHHETELEKRDEED